MTRRAWPLAVALAILLLATGLRFHRLGAQSFWNDEGNSARLSERSLPAILEGTAADVHPPLYYLLLRGWRELAGDSEFGLRALSAYAGVLVVAGVVAVARALGRWGAGEPGRRGAGEQGSGGARDTRHPPLATRHPPLATWPPLTAALLAAASPVLVYYSQETRMYALLALWAVLSTWALLNWLAGAGRGWAVAYTLLAAAGLYTHYFFPAVLAAHGLLVLVRAFSRGSLSSDRPSSAVRRPSAAAFAANSSPLSWPLAPWLLMAAAAVALYAPWLPIFLRQVGGRQGQRPALPAFLGDAGRWLVLGQTIGRDEALWALLAAAALVVLGLVAGRWRALVPVALALIPLGLMYGVGATDPAFYKFLLVVVPFLCLLMGLAWAVPRRRLWLPAALTAVVLAGNVLSLAHLYADPQYARADYRAIAARIAADDRDAGVILVAPNQWEVFTYYHRGGAPVYPLPTGQPDPALLEPELARIAAAHERLYVLYWGEAQRDPQGVIERWLDAHTFKAGEEWVGDVRLAVYAVSPLTGPAAPVPPTPSGAVFAGLDGERIVLREYTVWPLAARPGDVIGVRLAWSADAAPVRRYKVFVHLLAEDGRLVAQHDGEPGGGSRPTTGWAAGEVVGDNHGLLLPAGLPPGAYTLRLGLYDAFDPAARLPVAGQDGLTLATITVEE